MPGNRPHCLYPPTDYSVTLPEAIDFHRKHNPHHTAYVFSQDSHAEPTKISHLEFGRATDRVAHYLRPGRNGQDREVVAFVALSDSLLYQAVTLGITRAGCIPYPMSPRNTAAAIIKLLKDTSCHRLLTTYQSLGTLVDQINSELATSDPTYSLKIDEVPPLFDIFPKLGQETAEDLFEEYPTGTSAPLDDVLMYLHSSGSTGFPKTIPQTFRSMVHWASLPPVTDNITYKIPLMMAGHALPAFHTLGIFVHILVSQYSMTPVGLYPPMATTPTSTPMTPSPDNILDHTMRTGCNCMMIIPALLQIWSHDKKAVELLASLEFVAYSGGALPSKQGDFMTDAGVYLTPTYGATEFGAVSRFFRKDGDEKDWEWMWFSDTTNIHWDPQGDGTYEIQFLTSNKHQVSVENLENMRGYATSDLWAQHPTKPYFWKIVGRKDDVIVHTSGEKTVPAPMEDIIMSSPMVSGVVMFGRERDQAGVLIEVKPAFAIDVNNTKSLTDLRNRLWHIVEEANKVAPAFSRIFKEMILVAASDKPLPRAGKGTIMRKAALAEYEGEIDAIYANIEATAKVDAVVPPPSWKTEEIVSWLTSQLEDIQSGQKFSPSADLFEQGIDSLSATILRRHIVGAMQTKETQKAAQHVTQVTIYNNPSIDKLAAFISSAVADPEHFVLTTSKVDTIEAMISKYSFGLSVPTAPSNDAGPLQDGTVVLLTGSTGNLGAQILESLLRNPKVKMVYALNRRSSGPKSVRERQTERFLDKALDTSLLATERLVFLDGETSQKNLELPNSVYDEVRGSVTMIIHNAWRLDFNLSLSSFEANVQGTRNLIDLARSSKNAASLKFLFTSSVSSAFSWDQSLGAYPEEVLKDAHYAVGNGYGESKYVTERILAQSGLKATSFRIGQISGGHPNGAWATSDWVPILVKSSIYMNTLPSGVGVCLSFLKVTSWLPMDAVSQTILDVAWSDEAPAALNVVHPRPIAWNSILSSINDAIVEEGLVPSKLPMVDFATWVSYLEKHAKDSSPETLNNIPAIKLLDFFRFTSGMDTILRQTGKEDVETGGLAAFSTTKVQSISLTMKSLPAIGHNDARRWIKYWKSAGFIGRLL
ncbi:acetyl-CoA synthetase-like protein [Pholiota conissans]|uniref:Acetyl-CoA synthetase-like protein n=1 Tax=Pholiota conissans TaxID=109636 RepID=A0A9P6CS47_9AGAR|nr:acetyl-CoA synthetase-like protein [Pholiota conissans]